MTFYHGRGFTLIELMVSVVVMMAIMMFTIPGLRALIQNNRVVVATNDIVGSFLLARNEAVRRGTPVSICAATDNTFSACGTTWQNGWFIFVNPTASTSFSGDATQPIVRTQPAIDSTVVVTPNFPTANQIVTFASTGFSSVTGSITFTLSTPECEGTNARQITLFSTGRVSTARVACPL